MDLSVDLVVILVFVVGFALFRNPAGARRGNMLAAVAFAAAAIVVVARGGVVLWPLVIAVLLVAGSLAWLVAAKVSMLQIPAMVAFQNGSGGLAALLISMVELWRVGGGASIPSISALLGIAIGGVTFTGSAVAGGKLAGLLRQAPVTLRGHNIVVLVTALFLVAAGVAAVGGDAAVVAGVALLSAAGVLGILLAVRVGGADMPVMISFLNASSGLAAAFCGVVTESRLLVAGGAFVAASGTILTIVMCRAMNRSLANVLVGGTATGTGTATGGVEPPPDTWLPAAADEAAREVLAPDPAETPGAGAPGTAPPAGPPDEECPFAATAELALGAQRVVIVPGYGMALAQAQFNVVQWAEGLRQRGVEVKYAIHPVAGRMPGHMNVLLAEADASYDDLLELEDGNEHLAEADLAVVVGASDVVTPAAVETEGTPLSGMPILRVQDARRLVICNLDDEPGYSGVKNRLYEQPGVISLFGDARATFERLLKP